MPIGIPIHEFFIFEHQLVHLTKRLVMKDYLEPSLADEAFLEVQGTPDMRLLTSTERGSKISTISTVKLISNKKFDIFRTNIKQLYSKF